MAAPALAWNSNLHDAAIVLQQRYPGVGAGGHLLDDADVLRAADDHMVDGVVADGVELGQAEITVDAFPGAARTHADTREHSAHLQRVRGQEDQRVVRMRRIGSDDRGDRVRAIVDLVRPSVAHHDALSDREVVGDPTLDVGAADAVRRRLLEHQRRVAGEDTRCDKGQVAEPVQAAVIDLEDIARRIESHAARVRMGRGAVRAVIGERLPLGSGRRARIAAEDATGGPRRPVRIGAWESGRVGLPIATDIDQVAVGAIGKQRKVSFALSAGVDAAVGVTRQIHRSPRRAMVIRPIDTGEPVRTLHRLPRGVVARQIVLQRQRVRRRIDRFDRRGFRRSRRIERDAVAALESGDAHEMQHVVAVIGGLRERRLRLAHHRGVDRVIAAQRDGVAY